jgi:dihydrofolate reductase
VVTCSVFIATSLDGFIARDDGAIDWLPEPDPAEDFGYGEFIASVDAIVMGRKTFELASSFDPWPYGETPVVVLSSGRIGIPRALRDTVEHMTGTPAEIVRGLGVRGFDHLYVDGGATIRGFLADGLIRRITLTRIPVLLGSGIPLFGPLEEDIQLHHVGSRVYENGLVQSTYEVVSGADAQTPAAGARRR